MGGREGEAWKKVISGVDVTFDRCVFSWSSFEREERSLLSIVFSRVVVGVTCTRSTRTNCDIVFSKNPCFVAGLDHRRRLQNPRFPIERSISNVRYRNIRIITLHGRKGINKCACTHVVHKRMGISSRNTRDTRSFLKQTSENIFDLRKI